MTNGSADCLIQAWRFLATYDQEVFLVGGSVRQCLLDKPVKDFDFVVTKDASKLAYRLSEYLSVPCFPLDKERDMARVVLPEVSFDFASYGDDLMADLKQRDLCINAMACPVHLDLLLAREFKLARAKLENILIDPYGGRQDLHSQVVRGIESANFMADPLRLLRVYRFAATLGFEIESETEGWVKQHSQLIQQVAGERILQELGQILGCQASAKWVKRMQLTGLLKGVLPLTVYPEQLDAYEKMSSDCPLFLSNNVLSYRQEPLASQRPREFILKLAALILSPISSVPINMLGVQVDKLTLSRRELDVFFLWQRMIPTLEALLRVSEQPVRRFHLYRQTQAELYGLLLLARTWLSQGWLSGHTDQAVANLELFQTEWADPSNQTAHPDPLLDGRELMRALQLQPGPLIGKLLLSVQEAQADGRVNSRQQALDYVQRLLATDHLE
ncbi:MAG: hypothetical protein CVV27_01800 [Candidatus Melainabacteria bacterium HGW-Melainabacteria-1]|nr:MAG: hypothetical protein CVV27_01800 [Candidatus Melainabacteria bacterium HGW-Melainabacteria-1]